MIETIMKSINHPLEEAQNCHYFSNYNERSSQRFVEKVNLSIEEPLIAFPRYFVTVS